MERGLCYIIESKHGVWLAVADTEDTARKLLATGRWDNLAPVVVAANLYTKNDL